MSVGGWGRGKRSGGARRSNAPRPPPRGADAPAGGGGLRRVVAALAPPPARADTSSAAARILHPPAGVGEEVRGRQRNIHVTGFANRLAAVERFHDRQLARALLDQAGDPEDVLAALERRQLRPRAGGVSGRLDRSGDVLGPRERDL